MMIVSTEVLWRTSILGFIRLRWSRSEALRCGAEAQAVELLML